MTLNWADQALLFHEENPEVYVDLVRYARQARAAGASRIGIELLWNRMRWDRLVETKDNTSAFKMNQNYKAFYARLIMDSEPDLSGIFETRRLRS